METTPSRKQEEYPVPLKMTMSEAAHCHPLMTEHNVSVLGKPHTLEAPGRPRM